MSLAYIKVCGNLHSRLKFKGILIALMYPGIWLLLTTCSEFIPLSSPAPMEFQMGICCPLEYANVSCG